MTRRRMLDGLDAEIRDHIRRETEENIERGMAPEEARRAALRKFGSVTRVNEETREVWSWVWLEQLLRDARDALRMQWRNPGFTLVIVVTLALGIGMNTAIFSVAHAVLLKPLDYPNPDRLVWLADYDPNIKRDIVSLNDFYEWRDHAQSYAAMAAYGYQQATLSGPGYGSQVTGVAVAGDFWTLAGAQPAMGRLFAPGEQDAVVLAWDLFQREFSGDARIVGGSVFLDGRQATVAGVLPKNFRFQFPMWWVTIQPQPPAVYIPMPPRDAERWRIANVVAALRPGIGPGHALAELHALEERALRAGEPRPLGARPVKLRVEPLREKLVAEARPTLLVLLAAGGFVLLIACVNIASLLLARSAARQREIAIRMAVGGGGARVVRQLLFESLALAVAGGVAGVAFAAGAVRALIGLSPHAVPRLAEAGMDGDALAFAAAVAMGAAMLFGAGPALSLRRTHLQSALKEGARASAGSQRIRMRRLLVAVELALSIVLLAAAGLMVKSFWRMNARPPGFAPESVLTMKIRLAGPQYADRAACEAYVRELLLRLASTPGVQSAGLSNWFLFSGAPAFPADPSPDQTRVIRLNAASPNYLQAVGARLVKGRWLTDADPAGAVLLNESMARQAFGDADPIGRSLRVPQPVTVVGVVSDLKYAKLDAEPPPEVYVRYQQLPFLRGADVAVRIAGDPSVLAPVIRKRISDIDPSQPVYDMKTLEQALADSIAPRRFNLFLLGTFASAALLLAIVGVYGVIAYSVAERTREIGVRMALGARRGRVVGMVMREGMLIAAAGIAAGLAAALVLTRLMASLLYDVRPHDPLTFAVVAIVLAATALAASMGPALKAALVDPVVALRHE
ncbi:MAG: ABC transporter permease [Bryobacteraceae bacterium]|nr:ABC transporter permease [Bryobacteraceae bacterium]